MKPIKDIQKTKLNTLNDRQLNLLEAIGSDIEKIYWLTGGTQRLQIASINLNHDPVLNHQELNTCLKMLIAETYTPKQQKLIESASNNNTLDILNNDIDFLSNEATKQKLDLSKAELIECFQYLVLRFEEALSSASKTLDILEDELELMDVCEVCGSRQEHEPVHFCKYCEHSNNKEGG